MKVRRLRPSQLKGQKYNPPARTGVKNLATLKSSVKDHGILVPVLIDAKFNIIDGHRRVQCAKELRQAVPVIVLSSKLSTEEQFNNINTTSKKISTRDMIFIYLNGGIVSKKTKESIQHIETLIGKTNLTKLADKSTSPQILNQSKKVAQYCKDKTNQQFLGKIIMWLFTHKLSYQVRQAMENEIQPATLKQAIVSNKSIKKTWVA